MIWIYFIKDLPKSVVGNIKTTRLFKYIFLNIISWSNITVPSYQFCQFWFFEVEIAENPGINWTLQKTCFCFAKLFLQFSENLVWSSVCTTLLHQCAENGYLNLFTNWMTKEKQGICFKPLSKGMSQ